MKAHFAFIAALFLASQPTAAETRAPPFRFDGPAPPPTLPAPPPVDIFLGRMQIKFERTTLSDVQRAVGKGQVAHRGDAGESTYWLCYEGTTKSIPVRLWLIAGEIDGPDHTIGVVQLQESAGNLQSEAECPRLPQNLQPIKFGRAAVLGLAETAAVARLGKPSASDSDAVTYFHLAKRRMQRLGKTVIFDRSNFLELRLQSGKVIGIIASQSTTD